ncbi:hypothetical protein [Microbacterium candidum]|uniref:Uncharacterized protein n=1 Tax=Microbacterium candidum TaxID=3041922 RepID=A0ABT7MX99_9MICO|nr:hypothetical protein [Microbacterium sp. ASV49]MDL9979074.1 hypothetical protein [Microbacterium sp. ASV49]
MGDDDFASRQIELYENGPTLRYDLARLEDHFGQLGQAAFDDPDEWMPWNISDTEFEQVWNRREEYAAMTVNERLFVARFLDEWDTAINERHRAVAIDILRQVRLDEGQATATVDSVLANPAMYGFPRRA